LLLFFAVTKIIVAVFKVLNRHSVADQCVWLAAMSDFAQQRPMSKSGWRPEDQSRAGKPFTPIAGWIDVALCQALLAAPLKLLVAIDGCAESTAAFDFLVGDMLLRERDTTIEVLHIFDDGKVNLRREHTKDAIKAYVENKLMSSVSSKRYRMTWKQKTAQVGDMICKHIGDVDASFVCMGFFGRKGKKDLHMLTSNLFEVLRHGRCSAIIFKDEDASMMPRDCPTKFVVSVSLNKAATKAFLDALHLSKPGDEIHVVYVRGYLEDEDSDYTAELRAKYCGFFEGLQETSTGVLHKFHDRQTEFHMIPKQSRETVPQAVVRYADSIEADFLVVGTNAMRVEKGKGPVGSISLQICMETERNVVVANWIDLDPRVYEKHIRRPSNAFG